MNQPLQYYAVLLLLLAVARIALTANYAKYTRTQYGTNEYEESVEASIARPESHTFPNFTVCAEMCISRCTPTNVYIHVTAKPQQMFTCQKLKPPKATFMGSLRSSSFVWVLLGLGGLVLCIIFLLSCCYCCSSCCRPMHTNNSRGSSKDALHNDEGFREFLTDDVSAAKRDRDFEHRNSGREVNV